MKKILVRGPALSQSGYGEHTRFILRALRSHPELFDVYLITLPWGQTGWIWENNEERIWLDAILQKTIQYSQQGGRFDVSLQVTIPNEWEKLAPVNIGVTAGIETTKIAPIWVEKSLQMDKIIVVSEHAKYGFTQTEYEGKNDSGEETFPVKVTCPIDVIGFPVKEIEPENVDLQLKDDFNFLAVGTWISRKNLENTIKWFVEEFYDQEVGLIVKTSLAKHCVRDRIFSASKLDELLKEYTDRKCSVYLLHGDMTEEEMTGLYQHNKVKALISIAHGEGFGLPVFEAAYNGLPVVAPAWGGPCDYLYMPRKDKKGKVKKSPMFTSVAYDIKPIQPEAHWEGVLIPDSQWCFAKEWAYKKSLRSITKEYTAVKSKAKKLQKFIKDQFSQEVQFKKVAEAVGFEEPLDLKPQKINGISFCIPTGGSRNDKTLLTIESIKRQNWNNIPYEIILCGNIDDMREQWGITVVNEKKAAKNGKVAVLRNAAFKKSQYDTIVFCDDDIVLDSGWLDNTLKYSENRGWQVLGNKILNPDGTRHWDRATLIPRVLVDYTHPCTDKNLMQTSGFFAIRRNISEVIGWDETKNVHGDRKNKGIPEDVQFSLDLHKNDVPLSFNADSSVWHNDDRYTVASGKTLLKETITQIMGVTSFPAESQELKNLISELG